MPYDLTIVMKLVYHRTILDEDLEPWYGTTDIKTIEKLEEQNVLNDFALFIEDAELKEYSVDMEEL